MSAKKKNSEGGEASPLAPASCPIGAPRLRLARSEAVSSATPHEGLPEGWRIDKLINCTVDNQISYGIVQPGTHDPNGIPILRINNIDNGYLNIKDVLRVSPKIESAYSRTRLSGGEVLLTVVGSTGQSLIVPPSLAGWNIPRAIALIRPDEDIGARWINICLHLPQVRQHLDERANTTVQKTLNLKDVRTIPIMLPPKNERDKIAAILSSLDDKIELNRAMNETLESIARSLFKSWFVDFDPVRARAMEKKPVDMDDATAALFPDSFVDSELGPIPKGWEVEKLDNFFELAYGKALKSSDRTDGQYPVYGSGGITGFHNEKLVTGPGIIIGRKGSIGTLYWEDADFFPIDTVFYVVPKPSVPLIFIYYLLQTLPLSKMNTDAAVPGLNRNNVYRLNFVNPSSKLINTFMKTMKVVRENIHQNCLQTKQLETIHESLLPKLLSGEISVASIGGDAK